MEKPEFKIIEGGDQDSKSEEEQTRSDAKKGHPSNSTSPDWMGIPELVESSQAVDELGSEETEKQPAVEESKPVDFRARKIKRDLGRRYWGDK